VRHLLTTELATTIACSIVATRLDYCNSLLYGAPEATLDKLNASRITWRVSSHAAPDAAARSHCCNRCTGFPFTNAASTSWLLWPTRSNRPSRLLIFIHCSFHVLLLVRCAQAVRRGWSSLGHERSSAVALFPSRRRPRGTLSRIMSSTLLVWQYSKNIWRLICLTAVEHWTIRSLPTSACAPSITAQ